MAEEREQVAPLVDYSTPAMVPQYCIAAVAAAVCFFVAASAMLVLMLRVTDRLSEGMGVAAELLAYLGPLPAFVLGFRAMVILEKEENAHLRGRWMAACGLYGGLALLSTFCLRSMP